MDNPATLGARDRIVAAASDLMTRYGVAETSLKEIQAEAGVSASQIYHYFGDKNGLVRAVLEYRKDSILDLQTTQLAAVSSIDDLRRWAAAVASGQERLGFRGGCPIGSLSYELGRTDDEVSRTVASAFAQWTNALTDGIASLIATGVLPSSLDAAALATTLLAVVQGGLLLGQAELDGRALIVGLETVIALVQSAAASA